MLLAGTGVAAVPAGGVSPAAAQTAPRWELVAGNFFGDARDEEFFYVAGSDPDAVISLSNGGVSGDPITASTVEYNVTRTLDPFTGDFDGDGFDELFWYAPGSGADAIWNFSNIRTVTSTPISVSGTYTPLVGDFNGDNIDDVFWYAPGNAADTMWYFRQGGSHVAVQMPVRGTYRAFVASIGKDATDDIVWYAPGTAADSIWDFTRGQRAHTTAALNVTGNYRPIAFDSFGDGPRGDDIWWYAPGTAADTVWDYQDGVRIQTFQQPLGGNWIPTVGDLFADGFEDVDLIDLAVGETLFDFTADTVWQYDFRFATGASLLDSAGLKTAGAAEPQPRSR
jgi:hypothetical protein